VALIMGRLLGWSRRRRAAETRRYLELIAAEQAMPAGAAGTVGTVGAAGAAGAAGLAAGASDAVLAEVAAAG